MVWGVELYISEDPLWEKLRPSPFLFRRQDSQQVVKRAVESLANPVTSRIVGGCAALVNVVVAAQSVDHLCLKTFALVRVKALGYPIVRYP